jgi:putative hydrolase of the HAD superfamily
VTGRDPARIQGVLLDVDDTLVDTRAAFAAALAAALHVHVPGLDEDALLRAQRVWRADVGGHYRRYTAGEVDHRTQRMARANELHAVLGGPALDDDGFAAWDAAFEAAFAEAWGAHDDAAWVVDTLLAAGVAVAALTNAATAYQREKLRRVGLADRVDVVVGVDTLGVGKPDPAVFREACRRLGTEPGRTAYVGDELDVDALGAVAAGLVGVWVDRPGPVRLDVPPEDVTAARAAGVRIVPSLRELPETLGL